MVVFHVLRCAKCDTFQVLQVTKSKKWTCKLCGLKQSVIKVFGEGTGAECRHHVQKLNTLRGQADQILEEKHLISVTAPEKSASQHRPTSPAEPSQCVLDSSGSRWSSYLDDRDDCEESEVSTETRSSDVGGLRGHVTTDWGEFTKRKREFQAESQKRKMFRPTPQTGQPQGEECPKDATRLRELNTFSTRSPGFSETNLQCRNHFQKRKPTFGSSDVTKASINPYIKCEQKLSKTLVSGSVENIARSSSSYAQDSSDITKTKSWTPSSKEAVLDSSRQPVQQKGITKPKAAVPSSSKWAMFLNENNSEEEEEEDGEDSDGLGDQFVGLY